VLRSVKFSRKGRNYVLPARSERFNTNCAPDFFIMTYPPARERMLERASGGSFCGADGMSEKMLDAIRGANRGGARLLRESAIYGAERAILNDACGWSDEPIRVVMDPRDLVEVTPDTAWYLLGGG
jgi:hypothetical protein